MYATRNMIVALITTLLGKVYQLKRKPNPATMNPARNINPLSFSTILCSFCFSFPLSRFFNNSGFFNIITIPATNIGTNKIPINNQPLGNDKVPAGKNINKPIKITPNKNLVIAWKNNFIVIITLLKIQFPSRKSRPFLEYSNLFRANI